ncbi:MAG: 50S ribosomal protein L9, partial [Candidatus Omnitrophica bacterium]|nr:50S ribosomal protein L9 [Candidatus Omnitrophota bacterium]
ATEENLKNLELEKKRKIQLQEKEKQKAKEIAKKLEGLSINVAVQVHDEDELYGSVGPLEISKALQEEGFAIDKKSIILEEPIKKLGIFDCIVRLHPEVEVKIKVWVVRK